MDKFEYKVRAEEIKTLIAQGDYAQAAEIADTIDWRRVKSVMMLCTVSDLYKINRRYEDARDMLLLAYDRHPGGRTILYSLCELCIKLDEILEAVEYYKEFIRTAPRDSGRFILQYKLYQAQDVSLEERIGVLEQLKQNDYREKWAYELACLYHLVGDSARCVEECDELILWFGEGRYVYKAMELKMQYQPLTAQQQFKYDNRFQPRYEEPEGVPAEEAALAPEEVSAEESETWAEPYETEAEPVQAQNVDSDQYTDVYGQNDTEAESAEDVDNHEEQLDIQVKPVDVSQFNTINLQRELAEGLREVLGDLEPVGQESAALETAEQESVDQLTEEAQEVEAADQADEAGEDVYAAEEPEEAPYIADENEEEACTDEAPDAAAADMSADEAAEKEPAWDDQIEGQMSLDDLMEEWGRLKKEAELDADLEPEEAKEPEDYGEVEELVEIEEPAEEEDSVMAEEALEGEIVYEELPEENAEEEPAIEEAEAGDEIAFDELQEKPDEQAKAELKAEEKNSAVASNKARIRNLTKEERELFGSFMQSRSARQKLVTALDNISLAACTGNVIVTGEEGMDILEMAKNVIRDVKMNDSNYSGRTAKISAESLNEKDVVEILEQLTNGSLIIEKASGLNKETVEKLCNTLHKNMIGIIVVLADTRRNMNKFLAGNKKLEQYFNARIDMEAMSNEELVAFAKKYAHEMEYSIDDLGVLALHTRIDEMQTLDHAVTVQEVRDIMDEAIHHANRKSIGHFFDVLLAKRYDEEDMIILREEDFV